MSSNKVIFVGEQWGATGSHMTESYVTGSHMTGRVHVRNRKYVMRMRNRNIYNTPSGTFSPEVTSATGTFCITTRVIVQVHGCKGWKLRNFPLVGPFHRELATGRVK